MSAALTAIAFLISAVLTRLLLSARSSLSMLDIPNERSLHDTPVPSGGGIAIAAAVFSTGTVAALAYPEFTPVAWLGLAAGVVAAVSFADDRGSIRPVYRFGVHLLSAGILIGAGLAPDQLGLPGLALPWPGALSVTFTVLFVVWMINLYNFMDGMDGFAAGMALIGFGTYAILGWQSGNLAFSALSLIVAAAAAGFLLYNFPPARIFMGDTGSSLFGLLVAGFSLWADRERIFPLWIGILVFSPFVVDATVTLIRRVIGRDRVWEAHKTHFYQRLVQVGWGHRRTVLWEYVLMIGCGLSAIALVRAEPFLQWSLLFGWALAYVILMRSIRGLEKRRGGE